MAFAGLITMLSLLERLPDIVVDKPDMQDRLLLRYISHYHR